LTKITLQEIVGKKVIIIGEVGSGKTRLTAELLEEMTKRFDPQDITVIEMAPSNIPKIGGTLSEYTSVVTKVKYLYPQGIRAPRLEGASKEEVLSLAHANRWAIEPFIDKFILKPSSFLVMNDLSIYLQAGKISKIMTCMKKAGTFVSNAYYGSRLSNDKGSGISLKERKLVDVLIGKSEIIIRLTNK